MATVVSTNEVGPFLSKEQTIRFKFHCFDSLSHETGEMHSSGPVLCHGHMWSVQIYPRGYEDEHKSYVSVFLHHACKGCKNGDNVKVKFTLKTPGICEDTCVHKFCKKEATWGWFEYSLRNDLIEHSKLASGLFIVEARIQCFFEKSATWTPKPTIERDMLYMLEAQLFTDVIFHIGEEKIHAHRSIIACRSPALATAFELVLPGAVIPLDGIDPEKFKSFLRFIYGNEIPPNLDTYDTCRHFLEISDRFECTQLKLVVESALVKSCIRSKTCADLMLLADSHCCALLKEATFKFFVSRSSSVMKTAGWSKASQSAVLMAALVQWTYTKKHSPAPETEIDDMDVGSLRLELEKLGSMDVDGSREMLVKRLKIAKQCKE